MDSVTDTGAVDGGVILRGGLKTGQGVLNLVGKEVQVIELALLVEAEVAEVPVTFYLRLPQLDQELIFNGIVGVDCGVMTLKMADTLPIMDAAAP